jgi:hypothetical protein
VLLRPARERGGSPAHPRHPPRASAHARTTMSGTRLASAAVPAACSCLPSTARIAGRRR